MSTTASIKCTSDENTFWLSYGFFFTDTERKRVSSSGLLQVNTLKEIYSQSLKDTINPLLKACRCLCLITSLKISMYFSTSNLVSFVTKKL